jgi:hypothetical protein
MSLLGYPPLLYANNTATGNIDVYASELWGATVINTHATDSTTVQWIDNSAGSTPLVAEMIVKAGDSKSLNITSPVYCGSGLRVVITGGTVSVCTHWRRF